MVEADYWSRVHSYSTIWKEKIKQVVNLTWLDDDMSSHAEKLSNKLSYYWSEFEQKYEKGRALLTISRRWCNTISRQETPIIKLMLYIGQDWVVYKRLSQKIEELSIE